MTRVLHESLRSSRTSPIFAFYVLATLVAAGIIGLITVGVIDLGMVHFGDPDHRTHDVTYGLLFTTLVVGVLVQLRRPEKNVAAMIMALIAAAALPLAGVLSGDLDTVWRFNPFRNVVAMAVVAALLHPAGRGFFRSFHVSDIDRVMLALVSLAAVPWLAFAFTNLRMQRTVLDQHGGMGHYGFMAAISFTAIGVGLLASARPDGSRLTAWVAGLVPALLGVTSLVSPDAASSLDLAWALAALGWGVAFVAVAERTKNAEGSTLLRSPNVGKVTAARSERATRQGTDPRTPR